MFLEIVVAVTPVGGLWCSFGAGLQLFRLGRTGFSFFMEFTLVHTWLCVRRFRSGFRGTYFLWMFFQVVTESIGGGLGGDGVDTLLLAILVFIRVVGVGLGREYARDARRLGYGTLGGFATRSTNDGSPPEVLVHDCRQGLGLGKKVVCIAGRFQ